MSNVFFPSCKTTAAFPEASKKAAAYIKKRFGIDPIGCCRTNHQTLNAEDTAIVVCNNCAAIIGENTPSAIKSLWEIIDEDADFVFPDYKGEEITIQDCWIAFDKPAVQDAARSLLKKMNFRIVELEENREKTKFCGTNLLSPCTESNAKLVHKRYVEDYPYMFRPMEHDDQVKFFANHLKKIRTKRVACYCTPCTNGIKMGGGNGINLLELLFA